MTPERLQEIRERLEKATKGPWKWDGDVCNTTSKYRKHEAPWLVSDDDEAIPVLTGDIKARRTPDAQLISNAPQDIADLLAHTEALQKELAVNAQALRYIQYLMQDSEKFHKAKEYVERVINEQENTRKAVGE